MNRIAIDEKVINEGLRVALREKDATKALETFLAHIGKRSHSERIYIFEGEKGGSVSNTFEWCAEGVSAEIRDLQDVPFEAVAWWYQEFEKESSIIIKNVDELKKTEPVTYEYLGPQNIHSLIASPLVLEDEIIGFYGVDNPPEEIMNNITDFAEIIGHFITSLLERHRLMKQLKIMSLQDPLSKLQNRHALNAYMEEMNQYTKVGIAFCDVLGLKKVNDTKGHQAGDELLIRASENLKSIFRKNDLYRMGGDEFLILCFGIDETTFREKIARLRIAMKENDAMMSIGVLWKPEVTDLDAFISEADNLMYQEKRAYYASIQ